MAVAASARATRLPHSRRGGDAAAAGRQVGEQRVDRQAQWGQRVGHTARS